MHVGVFLHSASPQTGGGHTFEADLFDELLRSADGSRHVFTVFCRAEAISGVRERIAGRQRLRAEVHPREPSATRRWANRIAQRLPLAPASWRYDGSAQKRAADSQVDFVWCPHAAPMDLDVPYAATVWDLQHRRQPHFPEVSSAGEWDRREQTISRWLRRAARVIVGTQVGRDEVESFYGIPRERICILPHPTPGFSLAPASGDDGAALARLGLEPGYLFYPAQFWAHKNHVNLIHALALLRDQGSPFTLVLTGSDKGRRAFVEAEARRLGLADRVRFAGFVPADCLPALYRQAFALVYVTFFGPENLPPLEAFASGCPVIASSVAGSAEQLGDAALMVEPTSPESIAGAILRLKGDAELRKTLVERGRTRALRWTAREFVQGVFAMLDGFEGVARAIGGSPIPG